MGIQKLKNKVLGKSKKEEFTSTTYLVDLAREMGSLGDVLGRRFVVKNNEGKQIYKITQEPLKLTQINKLLKELYTIRLNEVKKEKNLANKIKRKKR